MRRPDPRVGRVESSAWRACPALYHGWTSHATSEAALSSRDRRWRERPQAKACATFASMTPNEVEAIVGGYHGDPFRVLGPHRVKNGWEIRSFQPQACRSEERRVGKECRSRWSP